MISSYLRKFKTWLSNPIGYCNLLTGSDFGIPQKDVALDFTSVQVAVAAKFLYWPIDRQTIYITQSFHSGHFGLDIGIKNGTKLYNPLPVRAQVVKIGWDTSGYGNMVGLKSDAYGLYVILAHMQKINPDLRVGQWLEPGAFVGWSDNTGNSTGPHLHLELRENDQGTGYYPYPSSCINPYPLLKWRDATPVPPPNPPPVPPPTQTGWYTAQATQELFLYRKQKLETRMNYPRIASGAVVRVTNRKTVGNIRWVMLENGYFTPKRIATTRYLVNTDV